MEQRRFAGIPYTVKADGGVWVYDDKYGFTTPKARA